MPILFIPMLVAIGFLVWLSLSFLYKPIGKQFNKVTENFKQNLNEREEKKDV